MLDRTFIGRLMAFKGEEDWHINECLPVEVTDVEKGKIEIRFTIGKVQYFLKFAKSELEDAINEYNDRER